MAASMRVRVSYTLFACILAFHPLLTHCRNAGEVTNEISAFVLDETENVRVMQCTIDTSPHGLAGVTFHDVTGGERTRLASVELVSRKCYSGQTLASCSFDDSKSSLTLKAAVTDLRVGERRRYECTVHYGTKTEKYQVNVTVDATATTSLSPLPSTEGNTEATTTLPSTEGNTEALDTTASTSTTSRTAKRRALAATTSDPLPSARPDYVHKTDSGTVTVDGISVGIGCGVMVALLALIALFVFVCRNRRKSFEGNRNVGIPLHGRDADDPQANSPSVSSPMLPAPPPPQVPTPQQPPAAGNRNVDIPLHRRDADDVSVPMLPAPPPPQVPTPQQPPAAAVPIQLIIQTQGHAPQSIMLGSTYLTPTHNVTLPSGQRPLPNPPQTSPKTVAAAAAAAPSFGSAFRSQPGNPWPQQHDLPPHHTFQRMQDTQSSSSYEEVRAQPLRPT